MNSVSRALSAACVILAASWIAQGRAEPAIFPIDSKPLLVMLQSPELPQLKSALSNSSVNITHDLPIINAIGARMDESQLEQVLASGVKITRVIDDLAWEPAPELGINTECPLKSAIELSWNQSTATWVLYNKSDAELKLTQGEISWPRSLGALEKVVVDDDLQSSQALSPESGPHNWAGNSLSVPGRGKINVAFKFENGPASPPLIQSKISLIAQASPDCKTKLVPSYQEPSKDSYFASVSGASRLHQHGVTGKGVTVAILDSGLWEEKHSLTRDTRGKERIVARYDAIVGKEVTKATDASGHGTHMLSVLARSDLNQRHPLPASYRGIAPDAEIAVVKAFGESGEAGFLDIVRGIQWVVENRERFNIQVLNLSFASRPRWPYWEDPVNQALMQAWKSGIFIVAAAGNEGPEPMTVGSPGNLPYLLTVGAITDSWTEADRNDDYIPDFSSRGPTPMGHIKPDVVAPGGHIAGFVPPNSSLARDLPEFHLNTGEFVMTGTSQAAALVSGLAALMLQVEPGRSNNELKCMITTSAEPAIALDGRYAYSPFQQGNGLVNVQRSLTIGRPECGQSDLNLDADIAGDDHFGGPAIFSDNNEPILPGQSELINPNKSEQGKSESRRWGVTDHLQRLESQPQQSPIDWVSIRAEEQRRLRQIAQEIE